MADIIIGIGICLASYKTQVDLLTIKTSAQITISLLLLLVYTGIENYF